MQLLCCASPTEGNLLHWKSYGKNKRENKRAPSSIPWMAQGLRPDPGPQTWESLRLQEGKQSRRRDETAAAHKAKKNKI